MKPITEERLKRVRHAVENGLSQDISQHGDVYVVTWEGEYIDRFDDLPSAIAAWDRLEANPPQYDGPRFVDINLDRLEGRADGGCISNYAHLNTPYEDTPDLPPSWDDYEFDEDGYKRRRK